MDGCARMCIMIASRMVRCVGASVPQFWPSRRDTRAHMSTGGPIGGVRWPGALHSHIHPVVETHIDVAETAAVPWHGIINTSSGYMQRWRKIAVSGGERKEKMQRVRDTLFGPGRTRIIVFLACERNRCDLVID